MNIFEDMTNQNKSAALSCLKQFIEALESGSIEIIRHELVSAPRAKDCGLVDIQDHGFFGLIFKKNTRVTITRKNVEKEERVVKVINSVPNEQSAENQFLPPGSRKISDREVELYKLGLDYACPCGSFKTSSQMGFKKHINKCEGVVYDGKTNRYLKK